MKSPGNSLFLFLPWEITGTFWKSGIAADCEDHQTFWITSEEYYCVTILLFDLLMWLMWPVFTVYPENAFRRSTCVQLDSVAGYSY